VNRTGAFLFVLLALAAAWEVWTLTNSVPGDTISDVIQAAAQTPLVTFLAGVFCGHWFGVKR
jgi:hypothetical protein